VIVGWLHNWLVVAVEVHNVHNDPDFWPGLCFLTLEAEEIQRWWPLVCLCVAEGNSGSSRSFCSRHRRLKGITNVMNSLLKALLVWINTKMCCKRVELCSSCLPPDYLQGTELTGPECWSDNPEGSSVQAEEWNPSSVRRLIPWNHILLHPQSLHQQGLRSTRHHPHNH